LWTSSLILAAFVAGSLGVNPEAAGAEPGPEVKALLERQAANTTRVRNGSCTGEYRLWADLGALKNSGASKVIEEHAVYDLIEFIGPPGGPLRYDRVAEPVKIDGKDQPGLVTERTQVHWDTKRLLRYEPELRFARIERVGDNTWAEAHPLYYGLTFKGRALGDVFGKETSGTWRVQTHKPDSVIELEYGSDLLFPAGGRQRVVVTMDTQRDMFIVGYQVFATVPGFQGERLMEEVSIKPVEVQAGIWFPAEVTRRIYRIDSPHNVARMDLKFSAGELNTADLQPEHLLFEMWPGTQVIDMTTSDAERQAEWDRQRLDKQKRLGSIMRVGDVAVPFEVQTLDGDSLRLSDFSGKYVLLDFWATWCGPCCGETPYLKSVYEAFGNDKRFAMVGLSLDGTKEAPREYVQENALAWTQGFLGSWGLTSVPDQYGVGGIPAIFLIDPDGNVIARDLRREGIGEAVAKVLEEAK